MSNLPEDFKFPPHFRSAKVIQVIEVVTLEGNRPNDPLAREVKRYLTLSGETLATNDPCDEMVDL